jgi:hypothetical protein
MLEATIMKAAVMGYFLRYTVHSINSDNIPRSIVHRRRVPDNPAAVSLRPALLWRNTPIAAR